MLRFPEACWVGLVRRVSIRAFEYRSLIHRISAVVMVVASLFHIGYVTFTARGRRLIARPLVAPKGPSRRHRSHKYNLGLSREKPQLDRFSYIEKSEYWALVWGTSSWRSPGVVMWFDNTFIGS